MSEQLSQNKSRTNPALDLEDNYRGYLACIFLFAVILTLVVPQFDDLTRLQKKYCLTGIWVFAAFSTFCIILALHLPQYSKLQVGLSATGLILIVLNAFPYFYYQTDLAQAAGVIAGVSICFLAEYLSRGKLPNESAPDV